MTNILKSLRPHTALFSILKRHHVIKAAGAYEDTRTGPNQVLRTSKVPRTGPKQVLDMNCGKTFKRTEIQGVNRSWEKNYVISNQKVF